MASTEEPHKIVVFDDDDENPRHWQGTYIMGSTRRRGTWLQTAQREEREPMRDLLHIAHLDHAQLVSTKITIIKWLKFYV